MVQVIRIRTQYGNFRFSVNENSRISHLFDLLRQELNKKKITLDDNVALVSGSDNPLDPSKTISESKITSDDLLRLVGNLKKPEPIPESEMSIYDLPVIRPKAPPCSLHAPGQSCVRCMVASYIRIDREKKTSKCASVNADTRSIAVFQYNMRVHLAYSVQRLGILYGTVCDDGSINVELIYEPPQEDTEDMVILHTNKQEQRHVEVVTASLGLQKVGCIFGQTAEDWEDPEFIFTAQQLLLIAEIHENVPEDAHFVILSVGMREGETSVEAFELTDQFYDLYKRRYFLPPKDDFFLQVKEPLWIQSKEESEAEVEFFIVSTPLKKHEGFLKCEFPVENRPVAQTSEFVKRLLEQNQNRPLIDVVSDFHLLLYLTNALGEQDVAKLCETVKEHGEVPEGYEFLIKNLAGMLT